MWLAVLVILLWLSPVQASTSVKSGLWSAPDTWDRIPVAKEFVVIAAGHTVTYDMPSSPVLAQVEVHGTLSFSSTVSTQMDVGLLLVNGGVLSIGTETSPLPASIQATVRLVYLSDVVYTHSHGQANMVPAVHTHGGTVDLHGSPHTVTWSLLAQDAMATSTHLVLADIPDWQAGDRLIVTGTNKMYVKGQTAATRTYKVTSGTQTCDVQSHDFACLDTATFQVEEAVVASVSGSTVTLVSPLVHTHLGTEPRRAAVGLLSRNITITSADPSGRRGHVMLAHGFVVPDGSPLPSTPYTPVIARISNVEFSELGRPEPGVYPVHFHRLGNAGQQSYLKSSAIHHTQNLCVRVHTTNLLTVKDNVCYKSLGHGYVTEDGSEMWNTFEHNLASRTQHAGKTNPNDTTDINEGTGFWVNNPSNYLLRNYASDTYAWGNQIDPKLVLGNPVKGTMISAVNSDGSPAGVKDVTTLVLGSFDDNRSQGNFFGGIELINLNTPDGSWIVLNRFRSTDGRFNIAPLATRLMVNDSYFVNGGHTWPGDYAYQDNSSYALGNFDGIALTAKPQHVFHGGHIDNMKFGYQFPGSVLLDHTSVDILASTSQGVSRVWALVGPAPPMPENIRTDYNVPSITSTQPHQIYLFDYDGPGKHVKLTPATSASADTLVYKPSLRFLSKASSLPRYNYQEASFTGTQGPELKLPLFINVGSRPATGQPSKDIKDTQGRLWRLDMDWLDTPPGYRLPKYGAEGVLRYGSDYSSQYGTVITARRSGIVYRVDLPNGTYHVDLHFVELNFPDYPPSYPRGVGYRVFDVTLESTKVLPRFDVYAQAGGNYKPLVRSFPVTITDGQLKVDLTYPGTLAGLAICLPSSVVNGQCQ